MDAQELPAQTGSVNDPQFLADNGEHNVSDTDSNAALSRFGTVSYQSLNKQLSSCPVPQKRRRGCGGAIGTRAEHRDDIANIGSW